MQFYISNTEQPVDILSSLLYSGTEADPLYYNQSVS